MSSPKILKNSISQSYLTESTEINTFSPEIQKANIFLSINSFEIILKNRSALDERRLKIICHTFQWVVKSNFYALKFKLEPLRPDHMKSCRFQPGLLTTLFQGGVGHCKKLVYPDTRKKSHTGPWSIIPAKSSLLDRFPTMHTTWRKWPWKVRTHPSTNNLLVAHGAEELHF